MCLFYLFPHFLSFALLVLVLTGYFIDLVSSVQKKEMLFDFRSNKPDVRNIQIDNSEVKCVKSYKYLGVNIESNAKWDSHVASRHICNCCFPRL